MGKPGAKPKYDRAVYVPMICVRLATGKEPMTVICADLGVPVKTVNDWRLTDEAIRAQFDEARSDGYDAIAADCLHIADSGNADDTPRAKLRVETRLKLLAKWDPRRYGDALKLSGDADNPVMGMTEAQVDARLAVLQAKLLAAKPDA